MVTRAALVHGAWKDEGDGYYSLRGMSPVGGMLSAFGGNMSGELAYVALPAEHPDVGKDYDELEPDVNGGLTFSDGRIFGWDYAHGFENRDDVAGDIARALEYFHERASPAAQDGPA